ncbi:hypothetical protein SAMN05421771_3579 [Granulicella pectinivorans]|uniref:Phage integrase family protein n=1 Tax=Granulicella pectinivorans TaxID=474950 RepID=A0A1I6MT07_9BACT|nr:hypothetical protein [Granulicella pectinivorans]SFS18843.1 hypothetical protein SAMN05421771_3579 [Granulicella pectinivorans]
MAYVPSFLSGDPEVAWEDVKTVQNLLRHANSSITLNLYAQAVTDQTFGTEQGLPADV